MRAITRLALSAATVGAVCVTGVPAANAICDPYADVCVEDDGVVLDDGVLDDDVVSGRGGVDLDAEAGAGGGNASVDGASLPRTGGELLLLSAVGVAALGGGATLVVAGRRRRVHTA